MNGNNNQERPNQLLQELAYYIKNGQVSKNQVLSLFAEDISPEDEPIKLNLQQLFYLLGTLIVIIGIVVFVYQFWEDMDQITKVLLTLGSAIASYSTGYYFIKNEKTNQVGLVFLAISCFSYPLGVSTTLDLIGISATEIGGLTIISIVLFMLYAISYIGLKTWLFLPFAIISGSSLFVTFTELLVENAAAPEHYNEYRTLILGIVYISLGYYYSHLKKKSLVELLYFFGFGFFLGAALVLAGFKPNINVFWQFSYPFLLVLTFYLSIFLQNKVVLIVGTIFTFAEIIKLTSEYFSNTLGWPIALIIAGLIMIAVGYFSFEVNKRLLKKPAQIAEN